MFELPGPEAIDGMLAEVDQSVVEDARSAIGELNSTVISRMDAGRSSWLIVLLEARCSCSIERITPPWESVVSGSDEPDVLLVRGCASALASLVESGSPPGMIEKVCSSVLGTPTHMRWPGEEVNLVDPQGRVVLEMPPGSEVGKLITGLNSWFSSSRADHLVASAAYHALFESVHPFRDGNGRTGRVLLASSLDSLVSPALLAHRRDYYRMLNRLNRDIDILGDWSAFVLECATESSRSVLRIVRDTDDGDLDGLAIALGRGLRRRAYKPRRDNRGMKKEGGRFDFLSAMGPGLVLQELLYGFIMELIFVTATRIGMLQYDSSLQLAIVIIGMNATWGAIDAVVFFLIGGFSSRKHVMMIRNGRKGGKDREEAISYLLDEFGGTPLDALTEEDERRICERILECETESNADIRRDQRQSALSSFGCFVVTLFTLIPVVLPILLIEPLETALIVASALSSCTLFFVGYKMKDYFSVNG
ncbi:MAG: Fic family protein, partial [Thermoplasmata archaeon]|nr:Fic family protein [Thermoplasmata archaeon]